MLFLRFVLIAIRAALLTRADLALENLVLRQRLAMLRQSVTQPKLKQLDSAFWITLSRMGFSGGRRTFALAASLDT
ncbi:MAG: hypothetical protein HYR85_06500 [Planctomycetes bacterium]|nr:hypothetical protein [Planctomycetota bacterium]